LSTSRDSTCSIWSCTSSKLQLQLGGGLPGSGMFIVQADAIPRPFRLSGLITLGTFACNPLVGTYSGYISYPCLSYTPENSNGFETCPPLSKTVQQRHLKPTMHSYPRIVVYGSCNTAREIPSSLPAVSRIGGGAWALRKFVPPVIGFTRRGSSCEEAAAFFNESIIRDIITGRYLKPGVSRLNRRS
jgi:hypothetical protein